MRSRLLLLPYLVEREMIVMPCAMASSSSCLPLVHARLFSFLSSLDKGGLTRAIPTHLLLTIHDLPTTLLPQFHESLDEVQAVSHVEKQGTCLLAQSHPSRSKASGPAKATLDIAFVGATTYTSILYLHLCCILIENSQDGALFYA